MHRSMIYRHRFWIGEQEKAEFALLSEALRLTFEAALDAGKGRDPSSRRRGSLAWHTNFGVLRMLGFDPLEHWGDVTQPITI